MDELPIPDNERYSQASVVLTQGRAALLAEMQLNGGNISKAARAIGMNESYARRLASQDEGFQMMARAAAEAPLTRIKEWGQLADKAQATLEELLDTKDQRVRFMAAREILDRAEGRPVQKVERKEARVTATIDQETMLAALSLVASGAVSSLQEGILKARTEPDKVKKWLEAGKEITNK